MWYFLAERLSTDFSQYSDYGTVNNNLLIIVSTFFTFAYTSYVNLNEQIIRQFCSVKDFNFNLENGINFRMPIMFFSDWFYGAPIQLWSYCAGTGP
jgi:hypothetical protein